MPGARAQTEPERSTLPTRREAPPIVPAPPPADEAQSGDAEAAEPPAADPEDWPEEAWDEEDWDDGAFEAGEWTEDDEGDSPVFLYKEVVLSAFASANGWRGLPMGDMSADHFGLSPRPPSNYVGVDLVKTFGAGDRINKRILPKCLPLTAMDLHPRLVYDALEPEEDISRIKFAPQDFWFRFNPGGVDRLSLRIGQFVLPYGVNPILAPRQRFILPIEATDLGLKWDWGIALKGPLKDYDWEVAATIGSGEGLYAPHLFDDDPRTSYLFTGRIGTPTYVDFQYGLSFLYGDLPVIRGPRILSNFSISRWRVGADAFYRAGTYLMAGAQLTYGQDGHGDDAKYVMISGGKTSDVLGARLWCDYVLPSCQDLRLSAQFESVVRDLNTAGSDDTAVVLEAKYSLSDAVSLMLDYRGDINRTMGAEDHALFFTFIYYAP